MEGNHSDEDKETSPSKEQKQVKKEERKYDSRFSNYVRFGPIVYVRVIALGVVALLLYAFGYALFAVIPIVLAVLGVLARSLYVYQRRQPDDKVLVGGRCLVIKGISKEERGIVKVYKKDGLLDNELWSAETKNGENLVEGKDAKIVGLRSIILLVEPIPEISTS
jgi:membrane protein implicated in regulation of membrane protease activity